jgi:hypothetical protein
MISADKLRIQAERLFAFALRTRHVGDPADAEHLARRAAQYLDEAERLAAQQRRDEIVQQSPRRQEAS